MYALAQRASEDVKVVLAGEGADELFAGYHWYQQVPENKRKVDFAPQFAHSLPTEHKVTRADVKRVVKRAVGEFLPDEIVNREKLKRTPYVDANRATALRASHRRGDETVGRTLWMILTHVAWYHTFVNQERAIV